MEYVAPGMELNWSVPGTSDFRVGADLSVMGVIQSGKTDSPTGKSAVHGGGDSQGRDPERRRSP